MKLGKKLIAIACTFVLVASMCLLVGCGGGSSKENTTVKYNGKEYKFNLVEQGKVTIGSDLDYPPFDMLEGETPTGLDVEMMQALCAELGLECNVLPPQNFDTIITSVASAAKMDVGCSCFSITDERKKEIDFTDAYFDSNLAVVVLDSASYKNATDLAGLKVGSQSGTTGEAWVAENIPTATSVPFTAITEGLEGLMAGQIEAMVFDLPVAKASVNGSFQECQIIQEIATGEQYGIVVSKNNKGLTEALNAALKTIKDNGTLEELTVKWLSA